MGEEPYDPFAYERRYGAVYEAGAESWEKSFPTKALVESVSHLRIASNARVVEFGCGEGRDAVCLAKNGLDVAAIDTSRSALKRSKERVKNEKVNVDIVVADVAHVPFMDGAFDLAVNIACLHMITSQEARDDHLRESCRVLKENGIYVSCNSAVVDGTDVEGFYKRLGTKPGTLTPRKITVSGKEREILLPIIAAWPKSKEQYLQEFREAGFQVNSIEKVDAKPIGKCWLVIACKRPQSA